MNQNELMNNIFSAMVNQAIMNQQKNVALLPEDQQDLIENKKKIKPEFQPQVFDAVILKIESETGWINGGHC